MVAKQVGENRVDRETFEALYTEEVGADVSLPVRRENDDDIIVDFTEILSQDCRRRRGAEGVVRGNLRRFLPLPLLT